MTLTLSDRYVAGAVPVVLTGVQAVARMLIEVQERERVAGRRTAMLVSGYQGSPLAGLDRTLQGLPALWTDHQVHLQPGLNEELAATAVWGSQSPLPQGSSRHDGVIGVWYGKAPGVDRSGDAFRHGNLAGAHPNGGVLVIAGDDPAAKSSTVPGASEQSLAALHIPVLFPRNAEELIRFGILGVQLSRLSGCWVGLKIVTNVADGLWTLSSTIDVDVNVPEVMWRGQPFRHRQYGMLLPPGNLEAEAALLGPRWEMVKAFGELNCLDQVVVDPEQARLGIVAAGTTFDTTVSALAALGLGTADLAAAGIRLLRIGVVSPLAATRMRGFARGLQTILVVEEKTSLLEGQVREILYRNIDQPEVLGRLGSDGHPLIPPDGELTVDRVTARLRRVLQTFLTLPAPPPVRSELTLVPTSRTPYFCSGCPHSRSTELPERSLAGGGIGCHAMTALTGRANAAITGVTQMGGEGAQWLGQAPFTDVGHIFQNLGDGTFFHSGQLAVQACVAAGVNITFKLLYNASVAMTGGQEAVGALTVPVLTQKLIAEGVRRVIVLTQSPSHYRRATLPPEVAVWNRDRLDEAQRILRDIPGVTMLVFDQQCAAEARRLRKRQPSPRPSARIVINEAVCEGCGDCGAKSNCLSVQPVVTELGRKTRIDQSSCNSDFACLQGDCPAFVTVQGPAPDAGGLASHQPPAVPEPARPELTQGGCFNLFLAGVGGTGIVTVNQLLATAAVSMGWQVRGLDQTGLSQKAGPVTSHLRIGDRPDDPANKTGPGQVDCYLAFDPLVGSDAKHLLGSDPTRTVVVSATQYAPTGQMVRDPEAESSDPGQLLQRMRSASLRLVTLDSTGLADTLFGNSIAANLLLVGAAYQAGSLPMSAASIEQAISLNGVDVEMNVAAFRWGRAVHAEPAAVPNGVGTEPTRPAGSQPALCDSSLLGEVRALVETRYRLLIDYQSERLARDYLDTMEIVWSAERRVGSATELSSAAAKGLHRFTAYKDEYEVARLLIDDDFAAQLDAQLPGHRVQSYHLHPPALRAVGLNRKLAFGRVWSPMLWLLKGLRHLRGTPFDPFGHTQLRRLERQLARDYRTMIRSLAAVLTKDNYGIAVAMADAAELVRGFENVKLQGVQRYRERLAELSGQLAAQQASRP